MNSKIIRKLFYLLVVLLVSCASQRTYESDGVHLRFNQKSKKYYMFFGYRSNDIGLMFTGGRPFFSTGHVLNKGDTVLLKNTFKDYLNGLSFELYYRNDTSVASNAIRFCLIDTISCGKLEGVYPNTSRNLYIKSGKRTIKLFFMTCEDFSFSNEEFKSLLLLDSSLHKSLKLEEGYNLILINYTIPFTKILQYHFYDTIKLIKINNSEYKIISIDGILINDYYRYKGIPHSEPFLHVDPILYRRRLNRYSNYDCYIK